METQIQPPQALKDMLRAVVMAGITTSMIEIVLQDEGLAKSVNRNVLQQTIGQLGRMEREIRAISKPTGYYLDKHLRQEKLDNIVAMIDLMVRIGVEEKQQQYEKFTDILMDCIWAVLYPQKHRKNIYFPKYEALFKLYAEEMKRDVNGEPKQLFLHDGALFMRTEVPEKEPKIS